MAMTLFHMWSIHRQSLIEGHKFYIDQSRKRLLSQFSNMEEESDKYAEEWLQSRSQYFDPDRDDPGDFYERANDEGIDFYVMLKSMRDRTRLSVVAGMFHEWDKQLRSWLIKEIRHWDRGDNVRKAIWKVNFKDMVDLLDSFGMNIKGTSYHLSLDRCRLVVNAYKHGDGAAFRCIKKSHPEFINTFMRDQQYIDMSDHDDLAIEEKHIEEFSNAIIEFWNSVPEYVIRDGELDVPKWFERNFEKDYENKYKKKDVS